MCDIPQEKIADDPKEQEDKYSEQYDAVEYPGAEIPDERFEQAIGDHPDQDCINMADDRAAAVESAYEQRNHQDAEYHHGSCRPPCIGQILAEIGTDAENHPVIGQRQPYVLNLFRVGHPMPQFIYI